MSERIAKRRAERSHTLTVTVDDATWDAFLHYCMGEVLHIKPGKQIARFLKLMAGAFHPINWLEEAIYEAFLKDGPEGGAKLDPHRIYLIGSGGKAVDVSSRFWHTA